MVGEEHLLSALNQEFINIVNKVGVDINECVAHPHTSNLVQFIGGLGPRKGASLLKTLRGMSNPRYLQGGPYITGNLYYICLSEHGTCA